MREGSPTALSTCYKQIFFDNEQPSNNEGQIKNEAFSVIL